MSNGRKPKRQQRISSSKSENARIQICFTVSDTLKHYIGIYAKAHSLSWSHAAALLCTLELVDDNCIRRELTALEEILLDGNFKNAKDAKDAIAKALSKEAQRVSIPAELLLDAAKNSTEPQDKAKKPRMSKLYRGETTFQRSFVVTRDLNDKIREGARLYHLSRSHMAARLCSLGLESAIEENDMRRAVGHVLSDEDLKTSEEVLDALQEVWLERGPDSLHLPEAAEAENDDDFIDSAYNEAVAKGRPLEEILTFRRQYYNPFRR